MDTTTHRAGAAQASMPAGLARSLQGMAALAALLICAEERLTGSLAGPEAAGVGVLVGRLQEDIALGIDALIEERPPN